MTVPSQPRVTRRQQHQQCWAPTAPNFLANAPFGNRALFGDID